MIVATAFLSDTRNKHGIIVEYEEVWLSRGKMFLGFCVMLAPYGGKWWYSVQQHLSKGGTSSGISVRRPERGRRTRKEALLAGMKELLNTTPYVTTTQDQKLVDQFHEVCKQHGLL